MNRRGFFGMIAALFVAKPAVAVLPAIPVCDYLTGPDPWFVTPPLPDYLTDPDPWFLSMEDAARHLGRQAMLAEETAARNVFSSSFD